MIAPVAEPVAETADGAESTAVEKVQLYGAAWILPARSLIPLIVTVTVVPRGRGEAGVNRSDVSEITTFPEIAAPEASTTDTLAAPLTNRSMVSLKVALMDVEGNTAWLLSWGDALETTGGEVSEGLCATYTVHEYGASSLLPYISRTPVVIVASREPDMISLGVNVTVRDVTSYCSAPLMLFPLSKAFIVNVDSVRVDGSMSLLNWALI